MKAKAPTFQELLEQRGIGPSELAKSTGIGRSSIYRWSKGRAQPRIAQARKLSDRLLVTVKDLREAISRSA